MINIERIKTRIKIEIDTLEDQLASAEVLVDILGLQGAANFDKGKKTEIEAWKQIQTVIAEEEAAGHNLLMSLPLRLSTDLAGYIGLAEFLSPDWKKTGVKLKYDIYKMVIGWFD